MTLEVDDDPDPAWLDVDGLRAEVVAAMQAAPDETWRVVIVARAAAHPGRVGLRAGARLDGRPGRGGHAEARSPGAGGARRHDDEQRAALGRRRATTARSGSRRADGVTVDARRPHRGRRRLRRLLQLRARRRRTRSSTRRHRCSTTADLLGPVRGRLSVTRRYAWPAGVAADGSRSDVGDESTPRSPCRSSCAPTSHSCGSVSRSTTARTIIASASTRPCLARADALACRGPVRRRGARHGSRGRAIARSRWPPSRPWRGSTPAASRSCSTTSPSTS